MEEHSDRQTELLAQIYNQLVDIKQILVEIELSRPGTTQALRTRLRQLEGATGHIRSDSPAGSIGPRQQKVISPTDPNIQPGEGSAAAPASGE